MISILPFYTIMYKEVYKETIRDTLPYIKESINLICVWREKFNTWTLREIQ